MELIQQYNEAKNALYAHVGFVPDWVVYPIADCTGYYWQLDRSAVRYAETEEELNNFHTSNYYQDDIYTQRFYKQWVYRGESLTMIMCDPHVDGVKFFDNAKEITGES